MRFCDNCGAGNPDSANKCVSCGAALPAAEQSTPTYQSDPGMGDVVRPASGKKSFGKLLGLGLAAVALVGGIAAAVVFGSDESKVGRAVEKAGSGVTQFVEEEPLLVQFGSLLGYHAYLKLQYLLPMRHGATALMLALVILIAFLICKLYPTPTKKNT